MNDIKKLFCNKIEFVGLASLFRTIPELEINKQIIRQFLEFGKITA